MLHQRTILYQKTATYVAIITFDTVRVKKQFELMHNFNDSVDVLPQETEITSYLVGGIDMSVKENDSTLWSFDENVYDFIYLLGSSKELKQLFLCKIFCTFAAQ